MVLARTGRFDLLTCSHMQRTPELRFSVTLGQALLLQNRIAGWASLVLFMPLYLLRVPREERMMLERFGDAYRDYMSRTGRIVPYSRAGQK
jgi:protein-S-isoprenylcysteine O-methyltransferase Ste14